MSKHRGGALLDGPGAATRSPPRGKSSSRGMAAALGAARRYLSVCLAAGLCFALVDGSSAHGRSMWGHGAPRAVGVRMAHQPGRSLRLRGGSWSSELSALVCNSQKSELRSDVMKYSRAPTFQNVWQACFGVGMHREEGPPMTVEVEGAEEIPGEGKPRRHRKFPELVGYAFDDKPEINTPLLGFYYAAERFPDNKCFGRHPKFGKVPFIVSVT